MIHDYIPELDGPQSRELPGGRRILAKGGGGLVGALVGAAAGAFLGPAAFGVSAMTGAAAGASMGSTLLGSAQQPEQPSINVMSPTAPPASQAAQAPNVQNVRQSMAGAGQGGGQPGAAQTFLTGAKGIDPSQLMLGKSTLLGG